MGVNDLRDAFNAAAVGATCTQAFLGYARDRDDVEHQILTFRGTDASGEPFEIKSDLIPAGEEIMMAVPVTAARLSEQIAATATKAAQQAQERRVEPEPVEAPAATPVPAPASLSDSLKALDKSSLERLNVAIDAEIKSRDDAADAASAAVVASVAEEAPAEAPIVDAPVPVDVSSAPAVTEETAPAVDQLTEGTPP